MFTIGLSLPSLLHPCRAATPATSAGCWKTPLHPSFLPLSWQQIKKKYIKCDYTGNMFIGTDTPGRTLFLECCITNGYTGRWGFTLAHVQCRQIWASWVYASHLCAKHKIRHPSTPLTPPLSSPTHTNTHTPHLLYHKKKRAKKRKKLIHRGGNWRFSFCLFVSCTNFWDRI